APPTTTADCLALLDDPSGWRRDVGQRLLVERKAVEAVPGLLTKLSRAPSEKTRIHALWTLEGLGGLTAGHVADALTDASPRVREQAVRLAPRFFDATPALVAAVADRASNDDAHVRLQVALALGASPLPEAAAGLAKLAVRDERSGTEGVKPSVDKWIAAAVLSSVRDRAGEVLGLMLADAAFAADGPLDRQTFVARVAAAAAGAPDDVALAKLLARAAGAKDVGIWWQTAVLTGVAEGLPRRGGGATLAKLLAAPPKEPAELAAVLPRVKEVFDASNRIAAEPKRATADRVAAVRLLGFQPFAASAVVFPQLLDFGQPVDVQMACIDAMQTTGDDGAAGVLFKQWSTLSPVVRGAALDLLARKPTTILATLNEMAEGRIPPSVVSLEKRELLLQHPSEEIRSLAKKLFGGATAADRAAVLVKYQSAAAATGDATAGKAVFHKVCAACHRINGEGHEVGPDVSDVRNKTRETLLTDILDPNRAVEPRFTSYVAATVDGEVLTGLLAGETADAVVLKRAEGKNDVIPRASIESIRASGKSLMPEGVEKD
ncbi:MAG: HEAT repeat domain-containing protein, partial [Planctomycetia bacterium]